jgi:hypothetical protein
LIVPWVPWIWRHAMLGLYDLLPTAGGGYELAQPWSPKYPQR